MSVYRRTHRAHSAVLGGWLVGLAAHGFTLHRIRASERRDGGREALRLVATGSPLFSNAPAATG